MEAGSLGLLQPSPPLYFSALRNREFVCNPCFNISWWYRSCSIWIIELEYQIDLIPFEQFLKSFSDSVILQAYVKAYSSRDYFDAYTSCKAVMSASQHQIFWICRSTGRLCIELNRPDMPVTVSLGTERISPPPPGSMVTLHDPNRESLIVDSLGLSQWYSICSTYLTQRRTINVSARAEVKLGSIVYWPSGSRLEDTTETASATYPHFNCLGWYRSRLGRSKNNTARCNLADVINSIISLDKYHDPRRIPWLSVANYSFNEHQIVSNHENYVLVDWVEFTLQILAATRNPPDGYLFLCSPADFDSGPTSFWWPDCPACRSLDPSGASRLSTEELSSLGFPCMKVMTEVSGTYWDEAVYAAVRKFHVGKGFDPESQDIARELGYPLFAVSVPISEEFAPAEFLELLKFGLIVALALVSLFEYLDSVL
ncbi:hypothetical protein C8R45DRAFT_991621 [Mycena sanguinolenta]|nr:hypothetical protein C8R45DRAFT_991621 [Mycena sanguinolenta]